MSDPVSITASIAGLIGLSGQIITALNNLYTLGKSAKNAPQSITRVMDEMQEMNGTFCQVQLFINGSGKKPSLSRLMMISIHHLVSTLSGCVLVCSNLNKCLSEVQGIADVNAKATTKLLWERVRWAAWKESEVAIMLVDLQRHKLSLNLMLTIIQCTSASEAQDSLAQLHVVVEQILETTHATSVQNLQIQQSQHALSLQMEHNQNEISVQLRQLMEQRSVSDNDAFGVEHLPDTNHSTLLEVQLNASDPASHPTTPKSIPTTTSAITSTTDPQTTSMLDTTDAASVRSTTSIRSLRAFVPSFHEALKTSRAYKRLHRQGGLSTGDSIFTAKFSTESSKGCTWSMLSNLSLGGLSISEISVIELPICFDDLWDPEPFRVASTIAGARKPLRRLNWSLKGRIHNAIASGNEYVVRTLLALGSDIEERDREGKTPLAHAVLRDREAIVKLLLEKGANSEDSTALGSTKKTSGRLASAIDTGNENVVRLLLAMGADLEERDGEGKTPLAHAVLRDREAILKLLLEKGANSEDSTALGSTKKTSGRLASAIDTGNENVVRLLLALGADVEARDGEGKTPLAHAVLNNQDAIVKLLWEKGANVTALESTINVKGRLRGAIECGNENVVRLLLAMGADLEERMPYNKTPLLYAACYGKLAIVKLLLEKGADVNARDHTGWTVLHLAARSGDAGMLQILLDNGALHLIDATAKSMEPGDTPLHIAARNDSRLPVAQMLVERGARVNPKDVWEVTPYQRAQHSGSPAVAKYLWSQLSPDEQAEETPPRE